MDFTEYKQRMESLQKSLLTINKISTVSYKELSDTINQSLNITWLQTIQSVKLDPNIIKAFSDLTNKFSSVNINWESFADIKINEDCVEVSNEAYAEMSQTFEPSLSDANTVKVDETDSRRMPTYVFIQWLIGLLITIYGIIQTQYLSNANTELLEKQHQENIAMQSQSISLQREEAEALKRIEKLLAILVGQEDTPTELDDLPESQIDIQEPSVDPKSNPIAPNQPCANPQSFSTEHIVQTEGQSPLK